MTKQSLQQDPKNKLTTIKEETSSGVPSNPRLDRASSGDSIEAGDNVMSEREVTRIIDAYLESDFTSEQSSYINLLNSLQLEHASEEFDASEEAIGDEIISIIMSTNENEIK